MLRFIVLSVALMAVESAQERPQRSFNHLVYSAASQSQIKNAIENNYDDTGPGAKTPDQAFKTFSTLEDALLNYLDDPDTKLPDHERARAVQKLVRPNLPPTYGVHEPVRYIPKFTNEYSKYKTISQAEPLSILNNEYSNHKTISQGEPLSILNKFGFTNNREIYNQYLPYHRPNLDFRAVEGSNLLQLQNFGLQNYPNQITDPYKFQTIQAVKSNPISLAHYTKPQELGSSEFNPNPQYSFSYGVHDKLTGDSKSAHETRNGGVVRGFYSFMDADGKQRTVRYTADDKEGFRAIVEKSHGEAQ